MTARIAGWVLSLACVAAAPVLARAAGPVALVLSSLRLRVPAMLALTDGSASA